MTISISDILDPRRYPKPPDRRNCNCVQCLLVRSMAGTPEQKQAADAMLAKVSWDIRPAEEPPHATNG